MSAFGGKADMTFCAANVRLLPKANIGVSIMYRLTFSGRLRSLSARIAHIREMVFGFSRFTPKAENAVGSSGWCEHRFHLAG
jgi:hypothetical protein